MKKMINEEKVEFRTHMKSKGFTDLQLIFSTPANRIYTARNALGIEIILKRAINILSLHYCIREYKIMASFLHPNLVPVHRAHFDNLPVDFPAPLTFPNDNDTFIVFEMPKFDGSFQALKSPCTTAGLKSILWQILCGVECLHRHQVIHRDLKPENIFINVRQSKVCVGDFGLSRVVPFSVNEHPGIIKSPDFVLTAPMYTRWYRAPEVILWESQYSYAADLWSIGCIMAFLADTLHSHLFPGRDSLDQLNLISQALGIEDLSKLYARMPPHRRLFLPVLNSSLPVYPPREYFTRKYSRLDTEGIDLLLKLLCVNPEERITASEALVHPYFRALSYKTMPAYQVDTSLLKSQLQLDAALMRNGQANSSLLWELCTHDILTCKT